MNTSSKHDSLSPEEKRKLLADLLKKKNTESASKKSEPQLQLAKLSMAEGIGKLQGQQAWLKEIKQANPYFRELSGAPEPLTQSDGRDIINFSSYNYLGLCGDPRVSQAAKDAIDQYGTSVGASRIASGERTIHRQLEIKMAELAGQEDAVCFVGGFGTNESVIGHLCGPKDLIVYDSLIHRSILDGAILSGARQVPFLHNDLTALEKHLDALRPQYENCIIAVEGLYSMDGDAIDLQKIVELKTKYNALLFVDEAHSFGVLGKTGRGIAEHCDVDPKEIDIWMCTLSKTFGSCGGIIAANHDLTEYIRYTTPGFLYSVGMSPANAAAATKAAELLSTEPERVQRVQKNGKLFWTLCQEAGISTGPCEGYSVVPVIIGDSGRAVAVSNELFDKGINAQPILFPAVPENQARLRFFITSEHTEEQIRHTVSEIKKAIS